MYYTYNINRTRKTVLLVIVGILSVVPESANAGEGASPSNNRFLAGLYKRALDLVTPPKKQSAHCPQKTVKTREQLANEILQIEQLGQEFKNNWVQAFLDTKKLVQAKIALNENKENDENLKLEALKAQKQLEKSHDARCHSQYALLSLLLTKPYFNATSITSFNDVTDVREFAIDYLDKCLVPNEDPKLQKRYNQQCEQEFTRNPNPSEKELAIMRDRVKLRHLHREAEHVIRTLPGIFGFEDDDDDRNED